MKSIMVGLLMAVLMLIVVSQFWPGQPEPQVRLAAPVSVSVAVPVRAPVARPTPLPKVVATPPAQRCETTIVSGSHTSRAEWEARQGALEDVADVCPAGKVTASPAQLHCSPVEGAQGIMGYAAVKCVQQAACTLCGDDLARVREVTQPAANPDLASGH